MNKIVIYYNPREQSPLMTDIYFRLAKEENIELVSDTYQGVPLDDNNLPDIVVQGIGSMNGPIRSHETIKEHGIKCVLENVSHTDLMYRPEWDGIRTYLDWDAVVLHWQPGIEADDELDKYLSTVPVFNNAIRTNIPWGIDPGKYKYKSMNRDIDVGQFCSFDREVPLHNVRIIQRSIISKMLRNSSSLTIKWGNAFGRDYRNYLQRTKLGLVDDTGRGYMTQKYLEHALMGVVNVGSMPECMTAEWGDCMIPVPNDTAHLELEDTIKKSLNNLNRLKKIRKRATEMVKENFHIDTAIESYLELFDVL